MQLPNLKEAKIRTQKEVVIKTSDYIINHDLVELGRGKSTT